MLQIVPKSKLFTFQGMRKRLCEEYFILIFHIEPPSICFNIYVNGDCSPLHPIYKKPNELISMAINGDLLLHLCRSLWLCMILVVASSLMLQQSFFPVSLILPFLYAL